jgi:hypothetical protein
MHGSVVLTLAYLEHTLLHCSYTYMHIVVVAVPDVPEAEYIQEPEVYTEEPVPADPEEPVPDPLTDIPSSLTDQGKPRCITSLLS